MIKFENLGAAENVSSEFIRAWAWAARAVLGFHNMSESPAGQVVRVCVLEPGTAGLHEAFSARIKSTSFHGPSICKVSLISLAKGNSPEDMAMAIVHEFVHAMCGNFGEDTNEKCTSTLTAKLKPDIKVLADLLIDGTYRRAAYIAHTKLSYRTEDGDYYDNAQHEDLGVTDKYNNQEAP